MENQDMLSQITAFIEKSGIKEQLKNPETLDSVYNMLTEKGINIDRNLFNTVAQTFANGDAELNLEKLIQMGTESGLLGDGLKNLSGLFGNKQ